MRAPRAILGRRPRTTSVLRNVSQASEQAVTMRLVVLGRGAAGKSVFARTVSEATGIPCVELDKVFWSADLEPTPHDQWVIVQQGLTQGESWILDGDLGPYDVLEARLNSADPLVVFDLPTWRCAWRAVRRSRERLDFWRWLLAWRRQYRPRLMEAIEIHAAEARLFVVRVDNDVRRTFVELTRTQGGGTR